MSKVGIVTDSSNCLPPELIKQYDIRVGSVSLVIDGKVYRDQVDITSAEFYRIYRGLKEMPTTIAVSPGDFADIFNELGKSTDSIVCIVISKVLSATYGSAEEAKRIVLTEHPGLNIEIIDSKTSTGAMGFIVLEAARAARAGKSLAEVIQVAQDMIPRVKLAVAMETLKYLIKIGRAPKTAYVGEFLHIKPIIGMLNNTGLVESLGKAMGKQKAIAKLVDVIKEHIDTSKPIHVSVHYTDRIEDGEKLRDLVTSQVNCEEVYLTPFTPVMASATGPVVALSFYS